MAGSAAIFAARPLPVRGPRGRLGWRASPSAPSSPNSGRAAPDLLGCRHSSHASPVKQERPERPRTSDGGICHPPGGSVTETPPLDTSGVRRSLCVPAPPPEAERRAPRSASSPPTPANGEVPQADRCRSSIVAAVCGQVAQLVEHRIENAGVGGSSPPLAISEPAPFPPSRRRTRPRAGSSPPRSTSRRSCAPICPAGLPG